MTPFFFGDSEKPLFGIYHPPSYRVTSDEGVLICYPIMQDYMRSHWALCSLAGSLAKSGFHVLRFDYLGTGDSAGYGHEVDLEEWIKNIQMAANELKDTANLTKLSIIGLRLGAYLAAKTPFHSLRVNNLILWDPVLNGKTHLDEIKAMHNEIYSSFHVTDPAGTNDISSELLGYVFPKKFKQAVEKVNLSAPLPCEAEKLIFIVSRETDEYLKLKKELYDSSKKIDFYVADAPYDWGDAGRFYDRLLVGDIPKKIIDIMCRK